MKKYEIYWHDLSIAKRAELLDVLCPLGIPPITPIATFEIQNADITPEDYDGPTSEVTLFYRDGADYKYTETFKIPTDKLEALKWSRKDAFYSQDDALISYDYDLGISRELFHETVGTNYTEEIDHNMVIIQEIDGLPNVHPEECIVHSSHGSFTFDPFTGSVITMDLADSFGSKPKKVDVGEWRSFYKKYEMPEELDILDIGFVDEEDQYEPAETQWRLERKQLQANEE